MVCQLKNYIIKLLPEHKVRTINKTCPNANIILQISQIDFSIKKIAKYLFCVPIEIMQKELYGLHI